MIQNNKWEDSLNISESTFVVYFVAVCWLICYGASLPKKIAVLRYFTFITAIINIVLALVGLFQLPNLHHYYKNKADSPATFPTFDMNASIFGGYCLSLFSCVNQFAVVSIFVEFKKPTMKRLTNLVYASPIIPLIVYLLVAIGGFYSFGTEVNEIVLNTPMEPGKSDLARNFLRCGLVVCLLVGITIRNQSNRANIVGFVEEYRKFKAKDSELDSVANFKPKDSTYTGAQSVYSTLSG